MSTQMTQTDEATRALWRLVVDDLIDREAESQVTKAWDLMRALFKGTHKLERKQISNLEGVAGETQSMAVVADFVRYQMGRDDKHTSWRASAGTDTFGGAVVNHIEGAAKESAERIIGAAKAKDVTCPNETEEVAYAWRQLVRRYVSYLAHAIVYEETMRKEQRQQGGKEQRR